MCIPTCAAKLISGWGISLFGRWTVLIYLDKKGAVDSRRVKEADVVGWVGVRRIPSKWSRKNRKRDGPVSFVITSGTSSLPPW